MARSRRQHGKGIMIGSLGCRLVALLALAMVFAVSAPVFASEAEDVGNIQGLQQRILTAPTDARSMTWLRVACPSLMASADRLRDAARARGGSYSPSPAAGRCAEIMQQPQTPR